MTKAKMLAEQKWPFQNPELLQLFSFATPNGVKVSIALEELAIPYEAHLVHLGRKEQYSPEFVSLSPNAKIPAIVDPQGPECAPLVLTETGAILLYLAEKTGRLLPSAPALRMECLQWLFFQVAHIGPMFGQLGHFLKFAKNDCADPYPRERYVKEANRLLGVLEARLEHREFLVGAYSIADIATFPWVDRALDFYGAKQAVKYGDFPAVAAWCQRCEERPAVIAGRKVCQPG